MKDFRELKVWEKSHRLTLAVYKVTATFPRNELYGLTGQIRRPCVSIPADIAEGCGRNGDAELARFLQIAMGSASELEYHILLAHGIGLLSNASHEQLSLDTTRLNECSILHPDAESWPLKADR